MTMILNCQLCGGRFYANEGHACPTTDSRIVELLEKILDRMPEPEKTHPCPGCGTFTDKRVCNSCWGTSDDPEAGYSQAESIEDKPAPADDLPGEPVEPSDLRAGDRVGFTWRGEERIIRTLVSHGRYGLCSDTPDSGGYTPNVVFRREWGSGISDVRLIERAPREDEDPNEALAMDLYHARLAIPPAAEIGRTSWDDFTHRKWLDVARAAREHIEAEWEEVAKSFEDGRDKWQAEARQQRERAEKAEAERDDAIRERDFAIEQRDFARSTRDDLKARVIKAEAVFDRKVTNV